MNRCGLRGLCTLPLLLSGCFSTHDGDDDPALRARAHEVASADAAIDAGQVPGGGNGGAAIASDGEVTAGTMASSDAGADHGLQVWVGAVHHRGGVNLVCGAEADVSEQARALLLLEYDERGELHGASLTLGEGPPLPPVADPDAYYPPDPPWTWHGCPMSGLVPGFEYPVHDARRSGAHLIATIHPADVIKEWCELQPSYPASPPAAAEWGEYLCRPTEQFQTPESINDAIPHPPGQSPTMFEPEELCLDTLAPCICDADSCTASPYSAFHLDVQLTGDLLSGSFGFMEIKLEREQ